MSNSLMKIVIKLIMVLMITTVSNCDSVTFPEDVERFDDVDIYNDDDEFDPENVFADDEELRDVGFDSDDKEFDLEKVLEMATDLMI